MTKVTLKKFGKYLLLDLIGTGGMAELYRAKITGEEGFEKIIAVKKVLPHLLEDENLVQAFIEEARLAAHLEHENIIRVFDFGRMADDYFIAMEFLSGKNLRLMLRRSLNKNIPLSIENSLFITSKILIGLSYAHALKDFHGRPLNIIHRDISPPNIFITYEGHVKILDFGIAKAAMQTSVTQVGVIKGHLAYISPEQTRGHAIDHRSDLFSVGCILYELLTGVKVFDGDTAQVITKVLTNSYTLPEIIAPHLPIKLCDIIKKSLQLNPNDRYQSAEAMLNDIEECFYEMQLRPTSRKLETFMFDLFDEQRIFEEHQLRDVLQLRRDHHENGLIPSDQLSYEHTVLLSDENDGSTTLSKLVLPDDVQNECPFCFHGYNENTYTCPNCGMKPDTDELMNISGPESKTSESSSAPQQNYVQKKVCVIGAIGSGKTSIVQRFVKGQFNKHYMNLAGVNIEKKELMYEDQQVRLNMWELIGIDRYHSLNISDLRDMDGYVLIVDGTRANTLKIAVELQKTISRVTENAPFICLVNKVDQNRNWRVDRKLLNELSQKGWFIQRTSAKNGRGINLAFMKLCEMMMTN